MNIAAEVDRAAAELNRAVTTFKVCEDVGRSGYPERLTSYYLIQALARCLEEPQVLLELPIPNAANKRLDNHIDATVFNEHTVAFCEFKQAWAPRHWDYLAEDAVRLQRHLPSLRIRSKNPKHAYCFYASDCWFQAIANAWTTGVPHRNWKLPAVFSSMQRGFATVSTRDPKPSSRSFDGHYINWAFHPVADVDSVESSLAATG